jgi:4a-hydroxytetrahydrobiopterin dehydratase
MPKNLADSHCKPCEGGVEPLKPQQCAELMEGLDPAWILDEGGASISRRFLFDAYSRTLAFANAVAWIAVVQGHHPVLTVAYGHCDVRYTTHAIDGLSDNDFICAAKVDRLARESRLE